MKVRCEIDMDTETGDYSFNFWNMTSPGEDIEYTDIRDFFRKVFLDVDRQAHSEEHPQAVKLVH